jgi:hypothetical protein
MSIGVASAVVFGSKCLRIRPLYFLQDIGVSTVGVEMSSFYDLLSYPLHELLPIWKFGVPIQVVWHGKY